jgi:hypothetical protein
MRTIDKPKRISKIRRAELPIGSKVRDKWGYIDVKIAEKQWVRENRWVAMKQMVKRPLRPGEKVFRLTPDRANNAVSNLVVIQQRVRRFEAFAGAKVVHIPKHIKSGEFTISNPSRFA